MGRGGGVLGMNSGPVKAGRMRLYSAVYSGDGRQRPYIRDMMHSALYL